MQRLRRAQDKDLDASIAVCSKQLAKALACAQHTKHAKILCGVNTQGADAESGVGGFLHLLFVFTDASGERITHKETMSIKGGAADTR